MELAEQVVPFGEHAQNLRMLFAGYAMQAAFGGSKQAAGAAERIRQALMGKAPKRRRRGLVAGLLAKYGRKGNP